MTTMKKLLYFIAGVGITVLLMPLTFVIAAQTPERFPSLNEIRSAILHPEGTTQWNTHVNKTFKFKIGYPANWKAKRFFPYLSGFQPPSMTGNAVQWAVLVIDEKDATTLLTEIAKMGSEFKTGRSQLVENIEINGIPATKVTIRTLENPTWKHEQVFVRAYEKIYEITNGGIDNNDFELFYSSFRLMD